MGSGRRVRGHTAGSDPLDDQRPGNGRTAADDTEAAGEDEVCKGKFMIDDAAGQTILQACIQRSRKPVSRTLSEKQEAGPLVSVRMATIAVPVGRGTIVPVVSCRVVERCVDPPYSFPAKGAV